MDTLRTKELVRAISTLPPEKVAEVYDFVLFLQARYGQPVVDSSDAWNEEDIQDLAAATLAYASQIIWAGEEADDAAG